MILKGVDRVPLLKVWGVGALTKKSMRTTIPAPLIAICAEVISGRETHASLDNLFMYAGAPGDPPDGSKHAKALVWLRRVNNDLTLDPLLVLGRLIEAYMEEEAPPVPP